MGNERVCMCLGQVCCGGGHQNSLRLAQERQPVIRELMPLAIQWFGGSHKDISVHSSFSLCIVSHCAVSELIVLYMVWLVFCSQHSVSEPCSSALLLCLQAVLGFVLNVYDSSTGLSQNQNLFPFLFQNLYPFLYSVLHKATSRLMTVAFCTRRRHDTDHLLCYPPPTCVTCSCFLHIH